MPAIGIGNFEFISDDFRAATKRRIEEMFGLALLALAVIVTLALATWSVQDPSLSHATDSAVRNLLGRPGAIVSDLAIQLFGLASIVLVLPIAIWGWRMLTHRPFGRMWIRAAIWIAGLVFASAFASCLPRTVGWPLPAGMGGVTGDAMLKLPLLLVGGHFGFTSRVVLCAIFGALAVVAFVMVAGFFLRPKGDLAEDTHREAEEFEEDEERTSVSLGWIVHTLLSLKARMAIFLRKRLGGDDLDVPSRSMIWRST